MVQSMSGLIIYHNRPSTWMSKRQKVIARSSDEAEIYAMDKCVKELLHLSHILRDMKVECLYIHLKDPIKLYNDNITCVY